MILTHDAFAECLRPHPKIAASIEAIANERYASHIKQKEASVAVDFGEELQQGITQKDLQMVPLFRNCDAEFRHRLAMSSHPAQFFQNDTIFKNRFNKFFITPKI